ncbi:MAG: DUF2970 domain-containing protein [Burkholderiales bacterium]
MEKKVGMLAAYKAVFWSFFGVRRNNDYAKDAQTLTLKQVIIAGIVAGLIFVFGLVGLVILVLRFAK